MAAGGFISRAFQSMLKECSGKKYPDLQKAIQTYLDSTKEVSQHPVSAETAQAASSAGDGSSLETEVGTAKTGTEPDQPAVSHAAGEAEHVDRTAGSESVATALANAGYTLEGASVELVLNPLRFAFETKNLKILESALDCLHKLIAYEHLEGDPGLDGGKNFPLFTDILNMVCNCIDNSSVDSTILQVLKVFLTAVASTKFRVHGESLLGVIRVCYNIALNSKSPINQGTSKAMLTQMVSIVVRRMENDQEIKVSTVSGSSGQTDASSAENSCRKTEETASSDQNENGMSLGDVLSEAKDTSLVSVEELHNLAGGADIKGLEAVLDNAVHLEDGKKIKS